jgi:hypothetical protein
MATVEMASGSIAGQATRFIPVHRQHNETPATITLAMAIPMSLEDVAAALYHVSDSWTMEELHCFLADADQVRQLVPEALLAAGADEIESTRLGFADVVPGTAEFEYLAAIRVRVAELFGTPLLPSRSCAARRTPAWAQR